MNSILNSVDNNLMSGDLELLKQEISDRLHHIDNNQIKLYNILAKIIYNQSQLISNLYHLLDGGMHIDRSIDELYPPILSIDSDLRNHIYYLKAHIHLVSNYKRKEKK